MKKAPTKCMWLTMALCKADAFGRLSKKDNYYMKTLHPSEVFRQKTQNVTGCVKLMYSVDVQKFISNILARVCKNV